MSDLKSFIEDMPKIELHLHIEGSLEPEQLFELAQRNNIKIPFNSVEEVRDAYNFSNLQDFLDIYYQGMGVLQTEQDFYDLTMAYMEKIASQNVRHTEIFFDPQGHTARGVDFDTVLGGISRALDDAQDNHGVSSHIVMCFLRHLPEEHDAESLKKFPGEDDAETTLDKLLASSLRSRVIGVGLDSSEVGHPPVKFENVFRRARQEGLKLMAHAGEEGPPDYVWEATDVIGVDRIDHGNRSLEDETLVKQLAREEMALTVCPLSNLRLCVVKDMKDHPIKRMLQLGLKPTVNSDDPAYFRTDDKRGGYMNENFIAVAEAVGLTKSEIVQLARNAIEASFLPDARKTELDKELTQYATKHIQNYTPPAQAQGFAP